MEEPHVICLSDYSWLPSEENQRRQARLCMSVNLKSTIVDINDTVNGPAVACLEAVATSREKLSPSSCSTVTLQRGKQLFQLPVIGQVDLVLRHARGRLFRGRSSLNLEKDAICFKLKTFVVEKLPNECKFSILAGYEFLCQNKLFLDHKNAQILDSSQYPSRTLIQYQQPSSSYYLRSHAIFWDKHYRPPVSETTKTKIVLPKECENCSKLFEPIGKNFVPKYAKGEHITYYGEIDFYPVKLGLVVRKYSNNHIITAIKKKNRSTMVLSVPECAVGKQGGDESKVTPEKFNKAAKLSGIKTENPIKTDSSTQTYTPNCLYESTVKMKESKDKEREKDMKRKEPKDMKGKEPKDMKRKETEDTKREEFKNVKSKMKRAESKYKNMEESKDQRKDDKKKGSCDYATNVIDNNPANCIIFPDRCFNLPRLPSSSNRPFRFLMTVLDRCFSEEKQPDGQGHRGGDRGLHAGERRLRTGERGLRAGEQEFCVRDQGHRPGEQGRRHGAQLHQLQRHGGGGGAAPVHASALPVPRRPTLDDGQPDWMIT